MEAQNADIDEDIMDIFGAVFDSDLDMLRHWATGVDQPARHTDVEIPQDELDDPSTDITQGHVSEYVSDQRHGEVSMGEGSDPDSRRVAEYFYFYGNAYDPEVMDCSQVNAFRNTNPAFSAEEELANILDGMGMPTVRNGGEHQWVAGWESLPRGDLPGQGARSVYTAPYPAPVKNIDPVLLDLNSSTSGPSHAQATQAEATQDHQPVGSTAQVKMKTCESCQKDRSNDFEVYKYVIPKGASHDSWVKAVGNFCLLNGPVCPYCRISIPDTTPVEPLLMSSDEWLQSIVQ